MNKIHVIGVVLVMALPFGTANANEFYIGADFLHSKFKFEGESLNPSALNLVGGTRLHPNFAIEARAGFGMQSDGVSATFNGQTISGDLEIDNLLGIYAKGILPMSDLVEVYGMVGYTRGKVTARYREPGFSFSASESENDFSFGVGAAFNVNPSMAINLEWARLLDKHDVTVDGLFVGFRYSF